MHPEPAGRPIDILLVEDNDDDVVLLREAFADARLLNLMQVVRDGDEALAYLRRQEPYQEVPLPSLILMDINMPKKNGLDVLREIKADHFLRLIPVAMLTTSNRKNDIVQSYAHGASSFITKPASFEQMRSMAQHLSLYWARVAILPRPAK